MPIERRISGFRFLVEGVQAYFADQQYSTKIHVGMRAYWEQWNQGPGGADRVVFIAGEFHGEQAYRPRPYGNLTPPLNHQRMPLNNPREVAQWPRPITISIWAAPDLREPTSELLQNDQVEALLERVKAAGQTVQAADIVWGAIERVSPPQERAFGEALLVHIVQRGPLFYPTLDVAHPTPALSKAMA